MIRQNKICEQLKPMRVPRLLTSGVTSQPRVQSQSPKILSSMASRKCGVLEQKEGKNVRKEGRRRG